MIKARFYKKKENEKIQCRLCPNKCVIAPGHSGVCKVRYNRIGELELPFYGKLSAIADDPIEKKPLYHFYPGTSILSIGFVGCSFHCPFCQNFNISQSTHNAGHTVSPAELVALALKRGSFAIAYTYSEPLIHLEYVLDTAVLAREKGLKNVLVSNGYINQEPAEELLELLDAANIDLKSFNPDFYHTEIGGKMEEVKRFIKQAAPKIQLEVTTLVIPTKNDTEEEISQIAQFLAEINPDIPYHLSCYYPTYKYSIPETQPKTVVNMAKTARKYLNYVYIGNVGFMETNTHCPKCNNLLIRRIGYSVSFKGVTNGKCSQCGLEIPIKGLS